MTTTVGVRHPILLVEDDANDVALVERAFRRAKMLIPLQVVTNGEDAIAYLAGTGRFEDRELYPMPEFVLLDLKLPRTSGHDVLRWIRREAGLVELPVVVLTASDEDDDLVRAYREGANSYLVKPASFEGLQRMIEALGLYWVVLNRRPQSAAGEGSDG